MKIVKRVLTCGVLMAWLGLTSSCATWQDTENQPPQITRQTPVATAAAAAVKFGGNTLKNAKKKFDAEKQWKVVGKYAQKVIVEDGRELSARQLLNGVNLYLSAKPKTGITVFRSLVKDDRTLARQVAWHIAATRPSKLMQVEIDRTVSQLLVRGQLSDHYIPEFAHALRSNTMKAHYTVARDGLFASNAPEFVDALIVLGPERASSDLMDYLARAPVEELRQLHMTTVNVFAAMEALEHLKAQPVSASHPKFDHLFLYSISRNTTLSELAQTVLGSYLVKDKERLSMLLSKQPTWIQLAFVETSGRNLTRNLDVFLKELEQVTAKSSVIEEIQAIRR